MEPSDTASDFLLRIDADHPGLRDPVYRKRRDAIAALALAHRDGQPAPHVAYREEEHRVWRQVIERIVPLRAGRACREVRTMLDAMPLDRTRIPQLAEVSVKIESSTGFRFAPVPGLIAPRAFLEDLADGVFRAAQYVRHPSEPFGAPEPDVVHELLGHAATLADPQMAELHRAFGRAAKAADDPQLARIERVYWFTLEHGIVVENGKPKAFGAALLSSCEELEAFDRGTGFQPWNLFAVAGSDYDPPSLQRARFVAPSFARLCADLTTWLERGGWRIG